MDLSIVVPCYNEAGNLDRMFAAFAAAMPADAAVEVIFVNNGSTDGSSAQFVPLLAAYPFSVGVSVPVNQGYGHGILEGLRVARGATVGWTHADLQTDPADVFKSYRAFRDDLTAGRVLVKGRRVARPLLDRLFTTGMSLVASLALGSRFSDINAQPKLFPRRLLAHMANAPTDFSLDLYVLWLAGSNGYNVVEIPVEFGRRVAGEAKGGGSLRLKWKLTRRTLSFIRELRSRIRTERN